MGFLVDPGELRDTITIKAVSILERDDGTWTEAPTGTDRRRAKFEWVSGEEFQDANRQTRTATRKVTFRFYDGLTPGHQLVDAARGKTFEVLAVDEFENRGRWHVIKAVEVV